MNIMKDIAQTQLVSKSKDLFTYYKKKREITFDNVLFIERILLFYGMEMLHSVMSSNLHNWEGDF